MGACILCGKSAGLFYSLHKTCFEKYNASEQLIAEQLLEGLGRVESIQLASKIKSEIASYKFAAEAQQRTLIRSLEYFAKQHIENSKNTSFDIISWIDVLHDLAVDESLFVNKHFVYQQQNLPALHALQRQELPESNANPSNFSIKLQENEQLWWCFNKGSLEKLKPVKQKRQWSVIMQLAESILPKKTAQPLERDSFGEGKILITSQRVCFETDEDTVFIQFVDLYSCTPVSDGVRLQSRQLTSTPYTYYCEDGRLLYGFIKYAQNNLRAS